MSALRIRWYGQSAFRLTADGHDVVIDPFGEMPAAAASRVRWEYPPVSGPAPELVLVTHEHFDHNGVEALGGSPAVLRSTAGRLESPVGEVVAVASEHDERAGTERGPNTIFAFSLGGGRVCHFGDFGQSELREEQADAIGDVDLLFVPVGGGPTIGADGAVAVVERLEPRWVLPMHYRTPAISFLEPADEFLARFPDERVVRLERPELSLDEVGGDGGPLIVVPAPPGGAGAGDAA